jgi:hypothetical protein
VPLIYHYHGEIIVLKKNTISNYIIYRINLLRFILYARQYYMINFCSTKILLLFLYFLRGLILKIGDELYSLTKNQNVEKYFKFLY